MLIKLIGWLIAAWLLFWLLGILLTLIPVIFFLFLTVTAFLFLYSLFPKKFRINSFEQWLGIQTKQLKTVPMGTLPVNTNSGDSPSSDGDSPQTVEEEDESTTRLKPPTISQPQQQEEELLQPKLNFDTIRFTGDKLPDREELKAKLKKKVIGQEAAIDTLVRLTMSKLAAKNSKPLVIFLPGPTGTGKTELSKALADALDVKLNRFDMGEYAESHKASNLFGSPKGYVGSTDGGALPNALRQSKKRCVLLFDEVEKAHQSLWRQMLAFFDEGRVSDTLGQTLAPKNTICLLTSNIEADKIAENPDSAKDIIKQCGYFPTEFLGRIDKVIPLLRLGAADTAHLTVILTKKVASDFDISLIIEQEALEELVNATFDEAQKYGGRGIMEKVKDMISDDLVDLQSKRIYQARLVVKQERLKAIPLIAQVG